MPVAQAGDSVAAVEIEDLAPVARVQPDALSVRHLDGILRENLGEVTGHQVHPGAGAVSPRVSSKPSRRFIHCTPPPAAPFVQVVEHRHHGDGGAVGDGGKIRVVAGRHVLDARRGVDHAHEGAAAVVLGERLERLGARQRPLQRSLAR
jgi:hypothetical protein